ncbi:MAG: hypothetical protein ABL962_04205, partial [Fimbriimonadaceae bacterium]
MSATHRPPEVGQLVIVRGRRFVATKVERSAKESSQSTSLVTLTSVEDDSLGEELQVIWELELDAQSIEAEALPEP